MSFSRSPTAMTDWRSMPPDASQPLRLRRSRHANKGPGSFGLAQFPSQTDWAALNRTGARCSPCRGYPLRDDCDAVAKFAYRCDGSCNLNFPRSLGAEREARVPTHDVVGHAYDLLVRWIKTGTAPPSAPRIQIAAFGAPGTPSVIARDDLGLALGGIRLSELAVPTAQNVGVNTGPGACVRWGYSVPFDVATLDGLYPSHDSYVDQVADVTHNNIRSQYIDAADGQRSILEAAYSGVGGA